MRRSCCDAASRRACGVPAAPRRRSSCCVATRETTMNKQLRLLLATLAFACTAVHAAAPVVLLRSDTTAAFFLANGGDYERILTPWRSFFARHGIKAREMQAGELASLRQPAVLVLASTVALGDAERDAIRARLAAGWSVLGTWALGVRDGKGAWIGDR